MVCGCVREMQMETSTSLSLGVLPAYTDIMHAITANFQQTIQSIHCKDCHRNRNRTRSRSPNRTQSRWSNRTKSRWSEIVAAPKILRIHLGILQHNGKIMHTMTYPQTLDLTAFQRVPTLPLRYALSSVIAHSGPGGNRGHYIASVRQRSGGYMCVSDSAREAFNLAQFLQSPQRPTSSAIRHPNGFQVYMLSYVRDDGVRQMPATPVDRGDNTGRGRLTKELRGLMS